MIRTEQGGQRFEVWQVAGVERLEMQPLDEAAPCRFSELRASAIPSPLLQQFQAALQPKALAAQGDNAAIDVQSAGLTSLTKRRTEIAQSQIARSAKEDRVEGGGSGHINVLAKWGA